MAQEPKKDRFATYVVAGIVIVSIALVGAFKYSENSKNSKVVYPSTVNADKGTGITFNGDLTGVPKVDIWEDFQCPICQQFEIVQASYIDSLITEKKAQVTFHTLSFLGDESVRAANAAACAADEDKFIDYHNALYANQPKTENSGEWTNDRLIAIGKVAGVTSKAFASCVNNGTYNTYVSKVAQSGADQGVNSTPTVFVNGKEIDRNTEYFSADKFKAAIERG